MSIDLRADAGNPGPLIPGAVRAQHTDVPPAGFNGCLRFLADGFPLDGRGDDCGP